jgi:hypothetical protein
MAAGMARRQGAYEERVAETAVLRQDGGGGGDPVRHNRRVAVHSAVPGTPIAVFVASRVPHVRVVSARRL